MLKPKIKSSIGGVHLQILVNGKEEYIEENHSLLDYLLKKDMVPHTVIVEYNQRVITSDQLANIILVEDDRLEILSVVGGG